MTKNKSYLNLLDESYPGFKANVARCENVGFPWLSKPFLKIENDEVVSHVGLLEYPIVIENKICKSAALHAVCTKSTHRGKGYASQLILEALEWSKNKYECVFLYTEIPMFYEKYSFLNIKEYRFHLFKKCPKGSQKLRPVVSPNDNKLFIDLFRDRDALSNSLWIKDKGDIAAFNTLFATHPTFWSLHYSPSANCIFSFEVKDKTLHLYDIVSPNILSLDIILDHLPSPIEDIYFYFSPDRLTNEAIPELFNYDNGYLMVNGNWSDNIKPFMIQPLSRC